MDVVRFGKLLGVATGGGDRDRLGFGFVIFLPVDRLEVDRCAGVSDLLGWVLLGAGDTAFGLNFCSVESGSGFASGSVGGFVDRRKSAKSIPVCLTLPSLGTPLELVDLAVLGRDCSVWILEVFITGTEVGGAADFKLAGFERRPFKPLSETPERLVEGRPASIGGGPDRIKSANSAVPVRL